MAKLTQQQKTIGDREVTARIMNPEQAMNVFAAVVEMGGEALFLSVKDGDMDNIGEAVGNFTKKLTWDKLKGIIQVCFTHCEINGKRVNWHVDFEGCGVREQLEVLFFVLKTNFADIFSLKPADLNSIMKN